jgi:hypothetical protein
MQSPATIVFKGSAAAPFVIVFISLPHYPALKRSLVVDKMSHQRIVVNFFFESIG